MTQPTDADIINAGHPDPTGYDIGKREAVAAWFAAIRREYRREQQLLGYDIDGTREDFHSDG